jgi:hypothetical protein
VDSGLCVWVGVYLCAASRRLLLKGHVGALILVGLGGGGVGVVVRGLGEGHGVVGEALQRPRQQGQREGYGRGCGVRFMGHVT